MSAGNILEFMRASKLLIMLATMATVLWTTGTANAASRDADGDHLPNRVEMNVTHTSPRDADTGNDGIKDGNEDSDSDGIDNTDELRLGLPLGDADNDGVQDGDEDDNDNDD